MVKTLIIYARLNVWAQLHQCKATARVTSSGAQIVIVFLVVTGWDNGQYLG